MLSVASSNMTGVGRVVVAPGKVDPAEGDSEVGDIVGAAVQVAGTHERRAKCRIVKQF